VGRVTLRGELERAMSHETQQERTVIEVLCEGCGDVPVNPDTYYCPECLAIIREDSHKEDPAKSHGRGGM
jgi:hypothetical protein